MGDSGGTAGRPGETGSGAREQDWCTIAGDTGAEILRLQIGSAGTWAPGSERLKAPRARAFPGSRQPPEFSPNPGLITFRTLQQCRYSAVVLALLSPARREERPAVQQDFGHPGTSGAFPAP
ncbi:4-Hydroxy-2-Oxoglutarate Aldolase [Manis pentadactyla]|nr:4-Hydroxy-2-Oxoglutarate Aldolase [Manis pentadactyla]